MSTAPATTASEPATKPARKPARLFGPDWDRGLSELPAWVEPIDAFREHLATQGRTTATAYGYCREVRALGAAHPAGPWELTRAQLETWLDAQNWSRATRHRALTSLRAFYAWAVTTGRCAWAPTAGIALTQRAPGPARRALPPAWVEPLGDYLNHLRAGARSPGTVERYRDQLTRLAQSLADPWTVTPQQLEDWLSNHDWAPETKRTTRAVLHRFYKWAEVTGRIDRSPATNLPSVRVPRAVPRPVDSGSLTTALANADDRERLALLLAALGGLRRAEIAGLHAYDIDHTSGVIVVRGKGGHQRRVPLHPALAEELAAEHTRRLNGHHGTGFSGPHITPDGYLFPSPNRPAPITPQHLGKLLASVLPDDWTAHSLRHRFATQAYAAERDIRAVQLLLGHSKPETTARYAATPEHAMSHAVNSIRI